MQEIIISIMESFGYLGIFLLILIENIFPPIPSEVILLFGGFMTTKTELTIVGVIVFSTIGSLLGAVVLYLIGKFFNKERLIKIVNSRLGRILRLNESDINKASLWFSEKGNTTVFFCRFVPVLRSLISIPAGMNEMPIIKFLIYTIVGSLIWNMVLTYLGYLSGANWENILTIFDTYSSIVTIILGLGLIVVIWFYYQKKIKKNK